MKGDPVEVVVDAGNGTVRYEIEATRAGRRVEVSTARSVVEVTEVTGSGTAVRSGRFVAAGSSPSSSTRRRPRRVAGVARL